jgi:CO/xanthine dehydrogenase FAD-binding subunit
MSHQTQYSRPSTLQEAAKLAQQSNSIALAGGALTLIGVTLPYEHVIDLQQIPALQAIELAPDHVALGGAVSLQLVVEDRLVPDALKPALIRTLSPNLRNGASVGESLIAPRPLREWLAVLAASDASVQTLVAGEMQEQSVEDFIALVEKNTPTGIVTKIILPRFKGRAALGTSYVARTPADHPIVNAAVHVQLDDETVVTSAVAVIGGASTTPILRIDLVNLTGNPLNDMHIDHAVKPIAALVDPVGDYKGSVAYRREMAQVCVRRALADCLAQLS